MKLPEHDREYDPRMFSRDGQTRVEGYRANVVTAQHVGDRIWEAESFYSLGCILQTNPPDAVEAISDFEQAIEIFRQEHEVRSFYEASLNLAAIYENRLHDKHAALKAYERAVQGGEITTEGTIEDELRTYVLHHIKDTKRAIQQDETQKRTKSDF
jgi:hypothetical protein